MPHHPLKKHNTVTYIYVYVNVSTLLKVWPVMHGATCYET